jgi:hypothetical protein
VSHFNLEPKVHPNFFMNYGPDFEFATFPASAFLIAYRSNFAEEEPKSRLRPF